MQKAELNQYWYSKDTLKALVGSSAFLSYCVSLLHHVSSPLPVIPSFGADSIESEPGKVAFLSTPSVYYSVSEETRGRSYLFDVRLMEA